MTYKQLRDMQIVRCPATETSLLQIDLATKAQRMFDTEGQIEWFTNLISVDKNLGVVVSEIEIHDLITRKALN